MDTQPCASSNRGPWTPWVQQIPIRPRYKASLARMQRRRWHPTTSSLPHTARTCDPSWMCLLSSDLGPPRTCAMPCRRRRYRCQEPRMYRPHTPCTKRSVLRPSSQPRTACSCPHRRSPTSPHHTAWWMRCHRKSGLPGMDHMCGRTIPWEPRSRALMTSTCVQADTSCCPETMRKCCPMCTQRTYLHRSRHTCPQHTVSSWRCRHTSDPQDTQHTRGSMTA